jgi:dephospho-CoA kinase
MPADEKAARANLVIDTNGSFDDTDAQIEQVFRQLRVLAATA